MTAGPGRDPAGATILIVDDNEDHRFLASRRLTEAGWSVRVAASASDALRCLDGVDLVLLDYRLPDVSGLDALSEIRRLGGPSVVMVTGMGSEKLAVEALRAGAIDYITKNDTYLEELPHDVERAWRHHDVQRRVGELQRLALLVTATGDRDREQTLEAIVEGAGTVLRADACTLQVLRDDGLRTEASAGEPGLRAIDLRHPARMALARRDDVTGSADGRPVTTDRLLLPIRSTEGAALGVLALLTTDPVTYHTDELSLARTFAAFAGIALANLHRLELEQRLVAEMQRLLDGRRDFVAHVSHELRTPLTCIEGFVHTLLVHGGAISDEERTLFLTKIGEHSHELHKLVEQLLDFAAVEAGRTRVDAVAFELDEEIREIVSGLAPLLEGRDAVVDLPTVEVVADRALLRRAITNLIANAAKYSSPGAPIVIRGETVASALGSPGAVRVEVVDQSPGIPTDELPYVFDPFWRGSTMLRGKLRGTGLGLSLVREYARLLGGEVGVASVPGEGSRFWFTVPTVSSSPRSELSAAVAADS